MKPHAQGQNCCCCGAAREEWCAGAPDASPPGRKHRHVGVVHLRRWSPQCTPQAGHCQPGMRDTRCVTVPCDRWFEPPR